MDSEGKVVNYYDPSFKLTKIEADIQKLLGEAKKQEWDLKCFIGESLQWKEYRE